MPTAATTIRPTARTKPLDPDFRGWGRTGADFKTGIYTFETVKPGAVAGRHTAA